MTTYKGTAVSAGIAQGKLLYAESSTNKPEDFCRVQITDSEAEIERLLKACNEAVDQLMVLYDRALENSGPEVADIFMVHSMMLQDDDFLDGMRNLIRSANCCAEYAVMQVSKQFAADLAESGSANCQRCGRRVCRNGDSGLLRRESRPAGGIGNRGGGRCCDVRRSADLFH